MPLQYHDLETIEVDPSYTTHGAATVNFLNTDKIVVASYTNVASGATGSQTSVSVAFTIKNLPPNYTVRVTPSAACIPSVVKTATGFTVTLTGIGGGYVPANVTFDVLVLG